MHQFKTPRVLRLNTQLVVIKVKLDSFSQIFLFTDREDGGTAEQLPEAE